MTAPTSTKTKVFARSKQNKKYTKIFISLSYRHVFAHTLTHSCRHVIAHTFTHSCTHVIAHTFTHSYTHASANTHALTHTSIHLCLCKRTQVRPLRKRNRLEAWVKMPHHHQTSSQNSNKCNTNSVSWIEFALLFFSIDTDKHFQSPFSYLSVWKFCSVHFRWFFCLCDAADFCMTLLWSMLTRICVFWFWSLYAGFTANAYERVLRGCMSF